MIPALLQLMVANPKAAIAPPEGPFDFTVTTTTYTPPSGGAVNFVVEV